MKRIAILLTCYNRKDKTIACLRYLYNCIIPIDHNFDVFLVDDGCTDGTSTEISEKYPQVNIIVGTGSLFWNRGMYLAWTTAKNTKNYDFYLWLNDDTILSHQAIGEMLSCEKEQNSKAIVCGAFCSSVDSTFTYGGKTIDGKALIPNGKIQSCYTINGNCVLINKEICATVGLLDPIYPHAIGDYEYGLRAMKHGFDLITTRTYIGHCEGNNLLPKWCYSSTPFIERCKSLYSPLGYSHPKYFFIFENNHYSLKQAVKHYMTIHLRLLIPSLWK
ncbi:glycosyltransferase family 2 protein [Spirosoma flavum]|uniref:Glycosyltransferase family 2 protein n=1 Tax=Spirosoma flavum TaxID=2048557 RepID=A0ABW6AHQ9_9BACT